MLKRLFVLVFVFCLISVFGFQGSSYAGDPDWRTKQDAAFEKLDVEPGDIITRENDLAKAETLLPKYLYKWFARGDIMDLEIRDCKYDLSHDDYWRKASEENRGKYAIDEKGSIIDIATGKYPVFVNGEPFPADTIDMAGGSKSASKVMYNKLLVKYRTGNFKFNHIVLWIDFKGGLERIVEAYWATYFYWGRKGGPVKNPENLEMRDMTIAVAPFDMAGTAQLSLRTLGTKDDQVYAYVPAIRRVKRLSGANRSDPYMGSEAIFDDAYGWNGLNTSMDWTYKGKRTALLWLPEWVSEYSFQMTKQPDGSWEGMTPSMNYGFETPGSTCATWAATNAVWVPREFYVVEGYPRDPYYSSGITQYWVDVATHYICYKWSHDKAGEFWKGVCLQPCHVRWGDDNSYGLLGQVSDMICDDKLQHATNIKGGCGKVNGSSELKIIFDDPKVTPRMLTVEKMKMWTK